MDTSRTKNCSSEEIKLLLDIIEKNKSVIECKKTDKIKSDQKEKAWMEIEKEFNASCTGYPRNYKTLKTKYLNIKASFKKRSAEEQKSIYKTGGGPYSKPVFAEYDHQLREIVPEKQVRGSTSNYDSDAKEKSFEISFINEDQESIGMIQELHEGMEPIAEIQELNDSIEPKECPEPEQPAGNASNLSYENECRTWNKYTPDDLKKRKSEKLTIKEKSSQSSWAKLAQVKAKWTEKKLPIECLKAEHALRVAQSKEMHEMQKKYLAEKHELEMSIISQTAMM